MSTIMKFRYSVIVVLAAAVVLAAGGAQQAEAKTFRFALQADAVSMDPYTINETMTLGFLSNIYEGLVRRGVKEEIIPGLATEWKLLKPDLWRFKLRANVKFHDGTPFTADDVIFSWKRAGADGSDMKSFIAGIKDIKKVDDLTIEITTDGPRPILTSDIFRWYIMSKEWCEKNKAVTIGKLTTGEESFATRNANGTGPFILKSREPDVKTVLEANAKWWDKPEHNVTEAIFTPIKSASTRVASFLSGELDMIEPVPIQDVERINKTAGLRVLQGRDTRTIFLGMDVRRDELLYSSVKGKNPLKDVRVRKAMYQAIDIETIKKKVMRDAAYPAALLAASVVNGYDAKLDKRFPYDPAASKKLLAEAGYPKGFMIVLDCPNDRYVNDEAISQAIAGMLAKVGIEVKLNSQTKSKHFAKIAAMDTSFYMVGWAPLTFDVHNTFFNNVMTRAEFIKDKKAEAGQGNWNDGGYSNPKVDEAMEKAATEVDPKKRQALISEGMRIHKEDVGHLPLHSQALAWGAKKNIDLHQAADNTFCLRWVKIK